MTGKSDRGNVKRLDPPEEERRKYLKTVGALVAGLAIGGAAGWLSKPAERVIEEVTKTVPGPTVTVPGPTVTKTVTAPITPTPTPTPTPVPLPEIKWPSLKGVEVTVINEAAHSPWIEPTYKKFEEITGATVLPAWTPYAALRDKVTLELSGHTGNFDVVQVVGDWFAPLGVPYIVPVKDWPEGPLSLFNSPEYNKEDLSPAAIGEATYKDVLYGLPYRGNPFMLYYRKDVFEKNGIPPLPPTGVWGTWHDLLPIMKKCTKGDMYGYGIMGKMDPVGLGYHFFEAIGWSWGADWFRYEDGVPYVTFNSPEAVEALQFWVDLIYTHKVCPEECTNWLFSEIIDAIASGRIAMMTHLTAYAVRVEATGTEASGKMGYALQAAGPGPKGCCPVSFASWCFGIPKDAKHKEAGAYLALFMTSAKNMIEMVKLGNNPTRSSTLDDPSVREVWHWWATAKAAGATFDPKQRVFKQPRFPEFTECCTVMSREISNALTRVKEPKKALDDAAEEVTEILRKAGYYK